MKMVRLFLFIPLLIFFFPLCPVGAVGVDMPVVTNFNAADALGGGKFIGGYAAFNSEVLIYIDGSFVALADSAGSLDGKSLFSFSRALDLADGRHSVKLVARDKTSLVLSPPAEGIEFRIKSVAAPTVIAPAGKMTVDGAVVAGLTTSGTAVNFFLDGQPAGGTELLKNESGTADFAYRPEKTLSAGEHSFYTMAQDEAGNKSVFSDEIKFTLENPYPAPVILAARTDAGFSGPIITGVAKNDSRVKVFIDGELSGEFAVKNNKSGTANFAYAPAENLTEGDHYAYTISVNKAGKQSKISNAVDFYIASRAKPQPMVTLAAASEKVMPMAEKDEPEADINAAAAISQDELEEILNGSVGEATETGDREEDNGGYSGRRMINLTVFLFFLAAVIAWIIWVNRELTKEKNKIN